MIIRRESSFIAYVKRDCTSVFIFASVINVHLTHKRKNYDIMRQLRADCSELCLAQALRVDQKSSATPGNSKTL